MDQLTADGFSGLAVILMAVGAAGVLASSFRTPARRLPSLREYWLLLPLVLMGTGDAAVGDGRPPVERVGKAAIAVLFWTSLAVVAWRRWRHRRRSDAAQ